MSSPTVDLSIYHPMERATQQNPFPAYAALRREAPVFHHQSSGLYMISTMDAVLEVLGQPNLFSSESSKPRTDPRPSSVDGAIKEIMAEGYPMVPTMLTADPPAQTRYRKSIGKPFTPRRIREFEPILRGAATELVEAWPDEGTIDFGKSFAEPFPIRAISFALRIEAERERDVKRWSDDSVASLGTQISDERRLEAARGVLESQRYWAARFDKSREAPTDDIVSNLVNADFEDYTGAIRRLEVAEFISMMRQFMVAGNETTTKLIGEAIRMLIENPEEWRRIQDDPSTIPAMVEEALRLASPNQGLFRTATEDAEVQGVPIPKGARLWVIFGSANRDEKYFPDPDRFDPTRENLRDHIAFGKGTHVCPGAPLSRLEAKIAFEELARRVESFTFAPGYVVEYEPSFVLRGLKSLELTVKMRNGGQ